MNIINLNNLVLCNDKNTLNNILSLNKKTEVFNLFLTKKDALNLIQVKNNILKENGRIEILSNVIETIIVEFCDSPYIYKDEYVETLEELINIFYLYQMEFEGMADEDIIKYMKEKFNTSSCGSLVLLRNEELDNLRRELYE